MLKRILLTILLVICLVAMIGTKAQAYGAWGSFGYSDLTVWVEVNGPQNAVLQVVANFTLQGVCRTDGQGNISEGDPFHKTTSVSQVVADGIVFEEAGWKTVEAKINMNQYESTEICQNPNGWEPVPDSIGVLDGSFTLIYWRCKDIIDGLCVGQSKKPFDIGVMECEVDEILRDPDGTTADQSMECNDPPKK